MYNCNSKNSHGNWTKICFVYKHLVVCYCLWKQVYQQNTIENCLVLPVPVTIRLITTRNAIDIFVFIYDIFTCIICCMKKTTTRRSRKKNRFTMRDTYIWHFRIKSKRTLCRSTVMKEMNLTRHNKNKRNQLSE